MEDRRRSNVCITLMPNARARQVGGDLHVSQFGTSGIDVHLYDLPLVLRETDDGVAVSFNYLKHMFQPAAIARIARHPWRFLKPLLRI